MDNIVLDQSISRSCLLEQYRQQRLSDVELRHVVQKCDSVRRVEIGTLEWEYILDLTYVVGLALVRGKI